MTENYIVHVISDGAHRLARDYWTGRKWSVGPYNAKLYGTFDDAAKALKKLGRGVVDTCTLTVPK